MGDSNDSRKRRKLSTSPGSKLEQSPGGGMFLDDQAIKRQMLSLLAGKRPVDQLDDGKSIEEESLSGSEEESLPATEEHDHAISDGDDEHSTSKPWNNLNTPEPSLPSRIPSRSRPPTLTQIDLKDTFAALGLSPTLLKALATISIHKPTEIQSACFSEILSGRDVIGTAKTGSGKTMAFALPILQRIAKDPFGIFCVVLTPTRELAYQLTEQFLLLSLPLGLKTITVVGGMDMMAQATQLRERPHVVVATPGRLRDLIQSSGGEWGLDRVKVLVLDEADRLLTPTFAPDLAHIFSHLPADRQTCLFTATISPSILQLAERPPRPGKRKPFLHQVQSETLTVADLRQTYLFLPSHVRDPYLYYLLLNPPKGLPGWKAAPEEEDRGSTRGRDRKRKAEEKEEESKLANVPSTIIFTQRCATAHLLHLILAELSIPSVPLHSHLTQPQRLLSLARFRAGEIPVLVTTDVGSRGLDIPEVQMVVNWDCPRRGEDYVHRVGRTARAGRGGYAVTVVTERDVELVKGIEELTNVKLVEMELPEEAVLEHLNLVSTARRVATMAMHDSDFGERQATNKAKAVKRARRDDKRKGRA